jgi:hypothetical protein
MPSEPILHAFRNIVTKDAVLAPDHSHPQRPDWPEAEFIIGNPPFIGGKDIRARLGEEYALALWAAHSHMNESADFVMYWWDRAAELLTRKGSILRRFGFVTTNSVSQLFQRRVMQAHLQAKPPVSIVLAIPDHPWTKASTDAAAVRIAMTVVAAGAHQGTLQQVVHEAGLDTDAPVIDLNVRIGAIHADLTIGVDVSSAISLIANSGLSSRGMMLFGAGFIVTRSEAQILGLGRRPGLEAHVRPYLNGRDLTGRSRGLMAIDLFGLGADEVRHRYPEIYQHLLAAVKPDRDANRDKDISARWWLFGRTRDEIRPALADLPRYIATVETAKHRVFQFLDTSILPDNKLVAIGSDDAFILGVLSSRIHVTWALSAGGWLGVGNDPVYVKSRCFDPFPFPDADDLQKHHVRVVAEELDAHRKRVLANHRHITLTGLYNVLEKLRAGTTPAALKPAERRIFDDGLVLILKELHDKLDGAVDDAYGWPVDLADEDILSRLVALNKERAKEEALGEVHWLRPDFQIPRFGTAQQKAELDLVGGGMETEGVAPTGPKPSFPVDDVAQTAAVMSALAVASGPMDAMAVASIFRQGRRVTLKVRAVLDALARMGFVTTTTNGTRYLLRRAA